MFVNSKTRLFRHRRTVISISPLPPLSLHAFHWGTVVWRVWQILLRVFGMRRLTCTCRVSHQHDDSWKLRTSQEACRWLFHPPLWTWTQSLYWRTAGATLRGQNLQSELNKSRTITFFCVKSHTEAMGGLSILNSPVFVYVCYENIQNLIFPLFHVLWREIHRPAECFASSGPDGGGVGSYCEGNWLPGRSRTGSSASEARRARGTNLSVDNAERHTHKTIKVE